MSLHRPRNAFSLLELLLSLAILGGSLAILSRIVETGTSAAIESQALSEARLVCQAKLTEVLLDAAAGRSPQSVMSVPVSSFDESSLSVLNYSVEILPPPIENVMAIRVTVVVASSDGKATQATFALTRWIVDPTLDLRQQEMDEQALREKMMGATGEKSSDDGEEEENE